MLTQVGQEKNKSAYVARHDLVWAELFSACMPFAQQNADSSCVQGLQRLGLDGKPPTLKSIGGALQTVGWRVVGVRGLIPPRAFALYLSEKILPIVVDLRPLDKLDFSPEPDLFHETFGHACQVFDPEYSAFLQEFGRLAALAFSAPSDELRADYFRETADLKARNISTDRLNIRSTAPERLSEREILTRFGWWTFEVGLIGKTSPKIFGAALLSSISESKRALSLPELRRKTTPENYLKPFDPTEPQTQYLTFESVAALRSELKTIENQMSFQTGGINGLRCALSSNEQAAIRLSNGRVVIGKVIAVTEGTDASAEVRTKDNSIHLKASEVEMICPLEAFHLVDGALTYEANRSRSPLTSNAPDYVVAPPAFYE